MVSKKKLQCVNSPELSWFNKIKELLKKYNLPSLSQVLKMSQQKTDGKNWLKCYQQCGRNPVAGGH